MNNFICNYYPIDEFNNESDCSFWIDNLLFLEKSNYGENKFVPGDHQNHQYSYKILEYL